MSGIGSQLKQTRESLGLRLEDVQQSTKIHIEYLRALEEDQFDTLPSPFYARAFLRTYAHTLGLDAQPLLDRYEALGGRASQRSGYNRQTSPGYGRDASVHTRRYRTEPRLGRTYSPRSQRMAPPSATQPYAPRYTQQTQRFRTSDLPLQGTGRFRPVGNDQHTLPPSGVGSNGSVPQTTRRLNLPGPIGDPQPDSRQRSASGDGNGQQDLSQTFVPRRVALEAKRGVQEGKQANKGGASKWIVRVAAIGALLLVPIGGLTMMLNDDSTPPRQAEGTGGDDEVTTQRTGGTGTVDAEEPKTVELAKVETGSEAEGDLYTLEGADKLEIVIKANKGESRLIYGYEVYKQEKNEVLKVGEKKEIDGKKFIWFRLFNPSNVEIQVNGQEIDTTAQDVPKSYRVELKK